MKRREAQDEAYARQLQEEERNNPNGHYNGNPNPNLNPSPNANARADTRINNDRRPASTEVPQMANKMNKLTRPRGQVAANPPVVFPNNVPGPGHGRSGGLRVACSAYQHGRAD